MGDLCHSPQPRRCLPVELSAKCLSAELLEKVVSFVINENERREIDDLDSKNPNNIIPSAFGIANSNKPCKPNMKVI